MATPAKLLALDPPATGGEVVTVKLTTGEELIARFEEDAGGDLITSKPVVLAPGAQGIGMVPWIMSAEPDKVKINSSNILTYATTQKEIADKYIEMTSSIKLV